MHGRRWVLAWVVAAYTVYHAPLAPFPNVIKMRPGGVLPVKTANSDCICMHTPWPVGEVSRCPKIPGCNLSSAMDSFLLPQPSARRKRPHNWDTRYRVFPLISFAWRLTLATTDRWRHEIVAKARHFFFHPGCFRATLDDSSVVAKAYILNFSLFFLCYSLPMWASIQSEEANDKISGHIGNDKAQIKDGHCRDYHDLIPSLRPGQVDRAGGNEGHLITITLQGGVVFTSPPVSQGK